jgi:hypothetical protein
MTRIRSATESIYMMMRITYTNHSTSPTRHTGPATGKPTG